MCKRAVELKAHEGLTHRDIGKRMQEEFSLSFTPAPTTIAKWLYDGRMLFWHETKEIAKQFRLEQFDEIEKLKDFWMDRALGKLHIKKRRMINGESVELIDESAYNEQARAAEVIVKLLARQAALFGWTSNCAGRRKGPAGSKRTVSVDPEEIVQDQDATK